MMAKSPAWQRAEGKNPEGGLNEKGRASLRAAGHDIKRPQPEGGARKRSFCARMEGMKRENTSAETARDPDSRINKSLRKWNCADGGAVDPYDSVQQAAKGGPIWDRPRPKKLGKSEPLSPKQKASAKAAAKAAGRPYPNLIDNMRAARADGGPVDDRAHEFVQEQLRSGEPQVPQYVAENDFPARAARGVQAVDTAASRVNNMLADIAGQPAMRSPEGRSASEIVQSAMPIDPYQAVQQAAGQWREGDKLGAAETMATAMPMQGAIRAYHGSPHTFDRFDISKIGTGEGAQAYGHGLYFAENEGIAKQYRDNLSVKGSGGIANKFLTNFGGDKERAAAALSELIEKQSKDFAPEFLEPKREALRILQSGAKPNPGSMYEVDIHANPEHLLDYNNPLQGQAAFKNIQDYWDNKVGDPEIILNRLGIGNESVGRDLLEAMGGHSSNAVGAANTLNEAGIPGIKYLDAGSRGAGEGSRNYVMFSHDPIEILRRYANGGEVEGDVQFAPEDPYAKVQEAARLPMMAQNEYSMRMPQSDVRYDTGPQPGEATMKAYEPTIKERIYQTVAGTEERPSPERAQFARGISNMAEFAPVLGNVMAGQEAQRRGDSKGMLMAALPVPGMATEARMAQAAITPAEQAAKEAYQRVLNAQGLYSHAAEAAANLPQAKGSYEQMMAMLQKAGVKPEELHWSGAQQFAGQPVTREQLVQHFEQGVPKIEESILGNPLKNDIGAQMIEPLGEHGLKYLNTPADIELAKAHNAQFRSSVEGMSDDDILSAAQRLRSYQKYSDPKFEQYTIPGGENYREVLMHMPTIKPIDINSTELRAKAAEMYGEKYVDRLSPEQWDIVGRNFQQEEPYRSSHWDQPNVLAHLRLSDRTGPKGEKILHMEELQSDWGQAGRKQGFREAKEKELADAVAERDAIEAQLKDQKPDVATIDRLNALHDRIADIGRGDVGVPSAPYVASPEGKHTSSWVDLGLKRALREAAEGGYNKLVWTPGAEQASRYDLSKHLKGIAYDPEEKTLSFLRHNTRPGLGYEDVPGTIEPHELEQHIGKEAAEKLLSTEPHPLSGNHLLEDQDLMVGGEGMKSFYDKIVPTQLQKILKKLDPDAKVQMGGHAVSVGKGKPTNYRNFEEWSNAPESRQINAHVIEITPRMREAILKGLPAFADGGKVVNKSDPYDNIQEAAKIHPRARRASH
jgi:hypothetical protein